MELILKEDVANLGKRGQLVKVAAGYGRNYLIPKGVAVPATKANIKMIEEQKIAHVKREAQLKGEAELLSKELNNLHLVLSRRAGKDTGGRVDVHGRQLHARRGVDRNFAGTRVVHD